MKPEAARCVRARRRAADARDGGPHDGRPGHHRVGAALGALRDGQAARRPAPRARRAPRHLRARLLRRPRAPPLHAGTLRNW